MYVYLMLFLWEENYMIHVEHWTWSIGIILSEYIFIIVLIVYPLVGIQPWFFTLFNTYIEQLTFYPC